MRLRRAGARRPPVLRCAGLFWAGLSWAGLFFLSLTLASAHPASAALLPAGVYAIDGVQSPPIHFASVGAAAAYISANGISGVGEVVFELRAGYANETGPVTIGPIPGAGPSLRVRFRPWVSTTPTEVTCTPTEDWAIRITGSYVTLDGLDGFNRPSWEIRALGTTAAHPGRSAVRLDGTAGLSAVTVKNCILAAGFSDGAAATLHVTGGTSHPVTDVNLTGNTVGNTTSPFGNRWVAVSCDGADHPGNSGLIIRGNTIAGFSWRGLSLQGGFPGALVENNTIRSGFTTAGPEGATCAAIHVSTATGTGMTLRNNFIYGLNSTGLGAEVGIDVENAPAAGAPLWIHTNRIDLYRNATVGMAFWGIRTGAAVPAGAPLQIDYNSVVVGGSAPSADNSAAFRREGAGALRLRNNIFLNGRHNTLGSGTHWAISVTDPGSIAEIGHNDYYVTGGTGQILGTIDNQATGNVASLALWQAGVPADAGSLNANPRFVNYASETPDLALTSASRPLESAGVVIPGIVVDYESELRFGSPGYVGQGVAPDIGVDEIDLSPLFALNAGVVTPVTPADGSVMSNGVPFAPAVSVKNSGFTTLANIPVRYRILGPLPAETELYNSSAVLAGPLAPEATGSVTFPPAVLTTPGVYAFRARTELPGDELPGNDELSGSLTLPAALAGTYSVGAGNPAPYQSLTSALAWLVQVGASGPVTFQLINNNYSTGTGETFPIVIAHYPGESVTNRLTIKPAPGATPAITGNATTILLVRGVDHLTLDGYGGSGPPRNLSLTNTSTSVNSAVLWARHDTVPDGVSDATFQNLVVRGSASTVTLAGIGFGGASISLTSDGAGHDGNVIRNCLVERAQAGIYLAGSVTDRNQSNRIEDNEIGAAAVPDYVGRVGILLRHEDGPRVMRNRVSGVRDEAPAGSSATFGISLGLPTLPDPVHAPPSATVSNADVSENRISGVGSASSPGYSAIGIAVGASDTGTNRLSNNTILGVAQHNPDIPTLLLAGIYVAGGAGRTELLFNSIALVGPRAGATLTPSFAIALDGAEPRVTLRNNIVANRLDSPGGTARGYALGLGGSTFTALDSDRNLFQVGPTAADGFAVVGGLFNTPAGDLGNLAAWQAATGQDGGSLTGDPRFADVAADLHIDTSAGPTSPAANAGIPLATVTTDFDGQPRAPAPDIGADEFTTHDLTVSVDGSGTVTRSPDYPTYNPGTLVTLTAAPPGHFVNWSGDASGGANPLALLMSAPRQLIAHFDDGTSGVPGEDGPRRTALGAVRVEAGGHLLIPYEVAMTGRVRLDLIDATGRRVAALLDEVRPAGRYALAWGKRGDEAGRPANGVYWLRLEATDAVATRRIVISR